VLRKELSDDATSAAKLPTYRDNHLCSHAFLLSPSPSFQMMDFTIVL